MKLAFRNTFAPPLAAVAFIAALLIAKWCGAAQDKAWQTDDRTGKTVKCQIVYINGDAVIRCPRPPVVVVRGSSDIRVWGAK